MLTNLFLSLGLHRDHILWFWSKVVSLALLINAGVFDLCKQAAFLGIPMSVTGAHWVQAIAVCVLYIAGQYSTSPLPGKRL